MTEQKLYVDMTCEQVFDTYADMVYRLAFARTGSRYDADDILQTVFMKLVKSEVVFRDREHVKAWLIKVTVNTSKNLLTSAWMRLTEPLGDDLAVEMAEKSEVYYAVMALPAKYRTAIHLYYYEGYSSKEIAGLLGMKEATVRTRLRRATEKLKTQLKGAEFDV